MSIKTKQEDIKELRTLKVLTHSLKYQLKELDSVNKRIDKLDSELQGDNNNANRREKN